MLVSVLVSVLDSVLVSVLCVVIRIAKRLDTVTDFGEQKREGSRLVGLPLLHDRYDTKKKLGRYYLFEDFVWIGIDLAISLVGQLLDGQVAVLTHLRGATTDS